MQTLKFYILSSKEFNILKILSTSYVLLPLLAIDNGLSQSSALKIHFEKIIGPGHEGGLSLF